jgi:hypothetical protein
MSCARFLAIDSRPKSISGIYSAHCFTYGKMSVYNFPNVRFERPDGAITTTYTTMSTSTYTTVDDNDDNATSATTIQTITIRTTVTTANAPATSTNVAAARNAPVAVTDAANASIAASAAGANAGANSGASATSTEVTPVVRNSRSATNQQVMVLSLFQSLF